MKVIQKLTTSTHSQHEKTGSCCFTVKKAPMYGGLTPPSTVLSAHVSPLVIPHAHSGRQCCYDSHFTVEKAEAQRGYEI